MINQYNDRVLRSSLARWHTVNDVLQQKINEICYQSTCNRDIVFQTPLMLRKIYLYPVCSMCLLTYFLLPSFYFRTILFCFSVFAVKSCLQAPHHKLSCPPSGCAIVIITVITRSFEVHVAGMRLMYSGGHISIILSSSNQTNWICCKDSYKWWASVELVRSLSLTINCPATWLNGLSWAAKQRMQLHFGSPLTDIQSEALIKLTLVLHF